MDNTGTRASNLRIGRAAMWGSGVACGMVALISWFAYRANSELIDANRWTNHAFEVIAELKSAEANLRGASSETRAFITSGDDDVARELDRELGDLSLHLTRLEVLTADNPMQAGRVAIVSELAGERADAMRAAAAQFRSEGVAAAQRYFAGGLPAQQINRVTALLDEIAATEQQILGERQAAAGNWARRSKVFLIGGGAGVFLVLFGAVTQLWREGSHRLRLEAGLRAAALEAERANAALSEVNQQLASANEGLTGANKELEAFSYTVSHDLRAPLRSIDGFSRILLEDYSAQLAPEAAGYLKRVRAGAQQMGTLIDDLLAFSRLGRQPMRSQSVDLGLLARQIVDQLREQQPERRIEVVIDPVPLVSGDPALLKQALGNLLGNAFKFTRTREHARVHVGTQANGSATTLFVRDNGVGFDMRYADKLFGVFQRLHRADEFEGTGVGLAIVQRIVHRHCGRVWAEGRPDEGAVFWLELPGEQTT